MEYHGLMRRLRAAGRRDGQRITLRIHRDEFPSLLRSLECLYTAAQRGYRTPQQLYQDIQALHDTLAAMNRELESLKSQLAEAKKQREISFLEPGPPLLPAAQHNRDMLDPWQRRMLEEADQRRMMRGRC